MISLAKIDLKLNNQVDENVLTTVVSNLFIWLGLIAVIMIIYGGVSYILAAGESGKVATAKKIIIYSVVGLILAALSFTIVNIVAGVFG